ncbi:UMP kinase [Candidatus Sumerlaeota bacterium]|nr:UMP kinase [Candidatus Sumerlaeota bacterium]
MVTERKPLKRVLLKLSGEALKGKHAFGVDYEYVGHLADEILELTTTTNAELGIVIGGGNYIRGGQQGDIDRAVGDYMGMLGTMINSMALQAVFEAKGMQTRVVSALEIKEIAESYIRRRAIRHLEKKRIVIFACGTGNPFFTTDTAAALRGAEIGAEAILKGTNVDGVYSDDPRKNPDAKLYHTITFSEALERHLKVMDATALALCRENNTPIIVFNMNKPGNIRKAIEGQIIGTYVGGE